MEQKLEKQLGDLNECIARIDERTSIILTHQERHAQSLVEHEARDREDFKDVYGKISHLEKKQNWLLGVGAAGAFVLTVVSGFFKGIFANILG